MNRTMPNALMPNDPDRFRLWREVQDMRVRTTLGGIFYLIAWLLCWIFSSAPEQLLLPAACSAWHSSFCWCCACVIACPPSMT